MNVIDDISIVENFEIILNSKIIIYGAGEIGTEAYQLARIAGCNVICFCDADKKKDGTTFNGLKVVHSSSLPEIMADDTLIIVSLDPKWYDEVFGLLHDELQLPNLFTLFSFRLSIFFNHKKIPVKDSETFNAYICKCTSLEIQSYSYYQQKSILGHYLDLMNDSVLVYQIGKVGSSTLNESIKIAGLDVTHCHNLGGISKIDNDEKLLKHKNRAIRNYTGKIIVLTREPISRDISQYFQLIDDRVLSILDMYGIEDFQDGFFDIFNMNISCKAHKDFILPLFTNLVNHGQGKGIQYAWFDVELKKNFGIDVFMHPFDQKKGYTIIYGKKQSVMVLQMEKMRELTKEIGDFLGIDNFQLQNVNEANSKRYRYFYKNFLREIRLPRNYIDLYYKDNQWFSHFYSSEDREKFYSRWVGHCSD